MSKNVIKTIFFTLVGIISFPVSLLASGAGTPAPTPNLPATSFHESMVRFGDAAARVVPVFVDEFEKPFAPYLLTFAWLLAIVCFLLMLFSHIVKNEGLGEDFLKFIFTSVFLFAVLGYCGDIDGNGRYGDIVDYLRKVGNSMAYGEFDSNGNINPPSFIQNKLEENKDAFNNAYKDFTKKSFTAEIKPGETAVIQPNESSFESRLFSPTSGGFSPQQVKENLKPENWDMANLFEWLNISRGIMELADLFLLILTGLLGAAMRLFFPLAVAAALHSELRGKTSMSFFWATGVLTLIVPVFTQIMRVAVYLAGNIAFQAATPTTDYFTFDSQNQAIIAAGNPVYMIFLMCFLMCLTALCIFASPYLGFQVATGNIVNGLIGTVSGWFSGMASIGLNAFTSALAGSYAFAGKEQSILRTLNQQVQTAQDSRQISYEQARGSYNSEVEGAVGTLTSSNISTEGQRAATGVSNRANFDNTIGNELTNTGEKVANTINDANKNIEQQNVDYVGKQGQTEIDYGANTIRNAPQIASSVRDNINEKISSVPVIGKIADAAGVNGNLLNLSDGVGNTATAITGVDQVTSRTGLSNSAPIKPNNSIAVPQTPKISGTDIAQTRLNVPKVSAPNRLPISQIQPPPMPKVTRMPTGGGLNHGGQGSFNAGRALYGGGGKLTTAQRQTAEILNQAMIDLGYTPQARQVMLGEFGRENGFRRGVISQGHKDDANGKWNHGIISWQGSRLDRLNNYMAQRGFLNKNGTLVDSEGSLRAQVGFMDQELRTGGAGWRKTHQMMTNSNYGQRDIAYRMGGKGGFIGYNNTNPKYNNAGHAVYASPNSAYWANKSYDVVAGNSSEKVSSVTRNPTPQFVSGKGFTVPNYARNITTGASSGKGVKISGGKISTNPIVNPVPNPVTPDSTGDVKKINTMSDTSAKAYAPQMATDFTYQKQSALNQYSRDANIGLVKQHSGNQVAITEAASAQRMEHAGNYYGSMEQSAEITAAAGYAANYQNYATSMNRAGINYNTSANVADMSYDRDVFVAQTQAEISIDSAKMEAMSSFIQSMGGSVSHQLGEAFEKFNRF